MQPTISESNRARVLAALKLAETFVQDMKTEINGDALTLMERIEAEATRIRQANASLVLAMLAGEYCPAEMFKPWASVRAIRDWRDDPKIRLDVVVKHGRCCVRPADFFAHWRTLTR